MRRSENLAAHELIGTTIEVIGSDDAGLVGVKGKVVGESRDTIRIKTNKKVYTIIKSRCRLMVTIPETGENVAVEGSALAGRPEDRIKKKKK